MYVQYVVLYWLFYTDYGGTTGFGHFIYKQIQKLRKSWLVPTWKFASGYALVFTRNDYEKGHCVFFREHSQFPVWKIWLLSLQDSIPSQSQDNMKAILQN